MLPDRVSNPGPLTYESGALPIALRGPANLLQRHGLFTYKSRESKLDLAIKIRKVNPRSLFEHLG